jgi:extradiol dioxygenase family protein
MRPNRHGIVNPGQTGRTHAVADPLESSMTTTGRIQLALNVTDLAAAVRVYSDVFGTEPSKQRPGYANFAIADPPLKLVLFENPDATSALNHLGVELTSSAEVGAVAARFEETGLEHTQSTVDRCCHALQDKVWVNVPDVPLGAWEFYTVLDDDPAASTQDAESAVACCADGSPEDGPCCGAGEEA